MYSSGIGSCGQALRSELAEAYASKRTAAAAHEVLSAQHAALEKHSASLEQQ